MAKRTFDNRLYYGDNLEILRKYIKDETIDLCYIDPPFNSKRNYNQIYNNIGSEDKAQAQAFTDTWTWDEYSIKGYDEIVDNSNNIVTKQCVELIIGLRKVLGDSSLMSYVISMTLRISEIHRVLKPTGCFYLHCDPTANHYLKLVLDSVFCSQGGDYLSEITWKRNFTKKGSQFKMRRYANNSDIILFYSKSNDYYFETQKVKLEDTKQIEKLYSNFDEKGRRFKSEPVELPAMMARDNLKYQYKGYTPPNGWMMSVEKLEELDKNGKLYFTKNGKPRRKNFMEDYSGSEVDNVWVDILPMGQKQAESMGYPTQKPEELLERIIKSSSKEGDSILDAYCGCGTSIAVAQKLGRNWIGIDITYQSISVILKRFKEHFGQEVIEKIELNGVPKDMEAAVALAHKVDDRVRKEFEKWAVLTYSDNKAIINEKKGADGGIDGIAYMLVGDGGHKQVLFSVKSGHVGVGKLNEFCHVVNRENAAMGIFITLEEPTKPMIKEAKNMGTYINPLTQQEYPKIEIVTIEEILKGKILNLPQAVAVLKEAKKKKERLDNPLGLNF